jgi:hypothetical protein
MWARSKHQPIDHTTLDQNSTLNPMPVECPSTVGRSKIGAWNSDPRLRGIERMNQLLSASEFVLGDPAINYGRVPL